jgi:succinate dehydrogenase (ubiquinone) cytochrome b560 subunit
MAKTGRPVSPHVTIYSFPITALTSITNRATGCALTFGAAGLGAIEIFGGSGAAMTLMHDIASTGPIVATGAKFSVAFPIVYHYLGGLRHLTWDAAPDMLTNVGVEKASYALAGSSIVISLGLALV